MKGLLEHGSLLGEAPDILVLDNLSCPAVELNEPVLRRLGIDFRHGDISQWSDIGSLPAILEGIAIHAENHDDWLSISSPLRHTSTRKTQ